MFVTARALTGDFSEPSGMSPEGLELHLGGDRADEAALDLRDTCARVVTLQSNYMAAMLR